MRTLDEIKRDVIELVRKCPGITEDEIGKQLKLSYRFSTKLFADMIKSGELCLN